MVMYLFPFPFIIASQKFEDRFGLVLPTNFFLVFTLILYTCDLIHNCYTELTNAQVKPMLN